MESRNTTLPAQPAGTKGKNLSILEFLDILQKEYIVSELRSKTYPRKKDRTYYKRVMAHKLDKIADITTRNKGIVTIFNSPEKREELYALIFPLTGGYPRLYYKDFTDRSNFEKLDYCHYYHAGADVSVEIDGSHRLGRLEGNPTFCKTNPSVRVRLQGDKVAGSFHPAQVTRIL